MKVITPLLICLSCALTGQSADVATVDFRSLEPVLKELVLSQPRNTALKQSLDEHPAFGVPPEAETDEQGNIIFKTDFKRAMAESAAFRVREGLRDEMRRELLVIISDLELGFDLIVDSSDRSAIIFSAVDPRDITQRVYQEVVFRLSNSIEHTTGVLQEE